MDRVSRLIFWLVLLACPLAFAETTVYNGQTLYRVQPLYFHIQSNSAYQGVSPSAVCSGSDWLNAQTSTCRTGSYISSSSGNDPGRCEITCTSGYTNTYGIDYVCPSGATKINQGAVNWGCWSSTDPANNCPVAGTVIQPSGTVFQAGDGLTSILCLSGCQATAFMAAKHEGKNWVWGPIISTGSQCQPSSAPGTTEATPKCSVGQCPGTLNGNQICVPCDETKQDTSSSAAESAASAASGAASGPAQTTTKNGSSSTTCKGESCTTTAQETVTNPDGSTGTKTTTTTQSKGDYCKENPKAGACVGTESVWGGTCGAFTCDGDAVQCAQAKAGWELACALKVDETNPLIGVGQQATAGGDRPADHPGNQANTIALDLSSRLSSVPLFGTSGDCIADKSITFMGKGYTLPFSKWCPYLNILGSAFLAACYLAAAFIIFRD